MSKEKPSTKAAAAAASTSNITTRLASSVAIGSSSAEDALALAPSGASASVVGAPAASSASSASSLGAPAASVVLSPDNDAQLFAATSVIAARIVSDLNASGKEFDEMSLVEQLLTMKSPEAALEHIVFHWCKPGADVLGEKLTKASKVITDKDVRLVALKLGLPVLGGAQPSFRMRESIYAAARAFAESHPTLWTVSASSVPFRHPRPASRPATPVRGRSASRSPRQRASRSPVSSPAAVSPVRGRRRAESPTPSAAPASSSSAAVDAFNSMAIIAGGKPKSSSRPASSRVVPPPPARSASTTLGSSSSSSRHVPLPLAEDASEYEDESSSDDDDATGEGEYVEVSRGGNIRKEELARQLRKVGAVDSTFADQYIANIRRAAGGRSIFDFLRDLKTSTWSSVHRHSQQECDVLARVLDAALADDRDGVLDLVTRRLAGVQTAVDTGSWAVCQELSGGIETRSFVPVAALAQALKSVVRAQAIKKSASSDTTGTRRSTGVASSSSSSSSSNKPWTGRKNDRSTGGDASSSSSGSSSSSSYPSKSGSAKKSGSGKK